MRRLFAVEGLACGGCARGLEGRLAKLAAVRSVGVHHLTASIFLDFDEKKLSVTALTLAVEDAGYRLIERHRPDDLVRMLTTEIGRLAIRLAVAVVFGMWSMVFSIALYSAGFGADTARWLALVSGILSVPVLVAGRPIFWMAIRSVSLRAPGMDLMVAVGSTGAVTLSAYELATGGSQVYFDTATMLVTLLLLARLVDAIVRRGTLNALSALQATAPEMALLLVPGGRRETPCHEIVPGDRVQVDAGAAITVDGTVTAGQSFADRAVLTGESHPVEIRPGMRVEAGCVNLSSRIVVEVERAYGDRDLDRMGGAIALEIARRGSRPDMAERMAGILAVAIPLAGFTTFATTFFLAGIGVEVAVMRALAVLAAGCPCALALAVPLAHDRASGKAAKLGLRLRETECLASLSRPSTVFFDKTGTLTEGRLKVASVRPHAGWSAADVLRLAARAETGIHHPIARAVIAAHGREEGGGGVRYARGASANDLDGRNITVTGQIGSGSRTELAVTIDDTPAGSLVLEDVVAAETDGLISTLRKLGIECRIATGDGQGAAMRLGLKLGFDPSQVHAGLTPHDKAKLVREAVKPVIFVGDGVNDAPALAAADCGVSVAGAHGAAAQTADLVIERNGLESLLSAMSLARRTEHIKRQNLVLSLAYNATILPLAIVGTMTPTMAAAAMTASSLSVMLNSARIGRHPRSRRPIMHQGVPSAAA